MGAVPAEIPASRPGYCAARRVLWGCPNCIAGMTPAPTAAGRLSSYYLTHSFTVLLKSHFLLCFRREITAPSRHGDYLAKPKLY